MSESQGTEARLLAQFRSQPVQVGEELYRAHVDAALRVARRETSDPRDAEDAVAEAFTRILAMMARGKGPERSFRSYLLRTVRSVLRERRRDPAAMESQDLEQLLPTETTEYAVTRREDARIVLEAYADLPDRWRDVLWRLDVEGQPPRVVAEQLGMSPNAVSALAVRAREGLKENFLASSSLRRPLEDCEEFVPMLAPYVRGRLTSGRTRRLQAHLRDCSRCNASYLSLVETSELMRAEVFPVLLVAAGFGMRLSGIGPRAWEQLIAPLGQSFFGGAGGAGGGLFGGAAVPGGAGAGSASAAASTGSASGPAGAVSVDGAVVAGGIGHAAHTLVGVGAAVLLCLALTWGACFRVLDEGGSRGEGPAAAKAPQAEMLDPSSQNRQDRAGQASGGFSVEDALLRSPGRGVGGTASGADASAADAVAVQPGEAGPPHTAGMQVDAVESAPAVADQASAVHGEDPSVDDAADAGTMGRPRNGSSSAPSTSPASTAADPHGGSAQEGPDADGGARVPDPWTTAIPGNGIWLSGEDLGAGTGLPTASPLPTVTPGPSGSPEPTASPSPTSGELAGVWSPGQPVDATDSPSTDPAPEPSTDGSSQAPDDVVPSGTPEEGTEDGETSTTRYCWDGTEQGSITLCECVWTMTVQGDPGSWTWECLPVSGDEDGAGSGNGAAEADGTADGAGPAKAADLSGTDGGKQPGQDQPEAVESRARALEPWTPRCP